MEKGNSNSFIKGAFILGIAAIIAKILGAAFKIPLGNLIADTGMGYYNSAYPIYAALLVVSTAGLPAAIAKMVSERVALGDRYGAHRVFKVSFLILVIIGLFTSVALFIGARPISNLVKNHKAYYSMIALSPALFFVSIMSSFRGYFQGLQNMKPTAISQIIEQFGRFAVGLYLAYQFSKVSLEKAAAGATFGATAGAFLGSIFITYIYLTYRKNKFGQIKNTSINQESSASIIKNLLLIAIPITIGAAVLPLMNLIDTGIVMRRLTAIGYEYDTANRLWGQIGLGNNIINLPQAITAALQVSLVPAIAYVVARRDRVQLIQNIETGVRVTLLIALPAAVGLSILSEEIMLLLYPSQMEAAIGAGEILRISAWGVVFLSLFQTFTGILQGLGKQLIPAGNLLIGALLKLVLSYILIGIPAINIKGAVIATLAGFILACILNFIFVKIYTRVKFNIIQDIIKPIIAVITMALVVKYSHISLGLFISSRMATVISIALGAFVYGIMLLLTRALNDKDFELMPGGKKLYRIAKIFYKK
ncbi:putative polysaccharide biosynthesis protein [Paramaledivibacter caminithermalis]|jgi:stage V sporulation protein B|uniref:Stage V sporulation protein B n=1 Tax=Paramaledivibacter caminithermalis (strain DSM 15212 / CIP 107654 / DViRD3) TaxID=1121301 RepID=A0A1M6QMX4_PARC5|nr:polysaccharide biosynthesis protein [Paramaledivibacter caminithermalis]SHK21594.1 stage V sporulation protein B [Paramaledivibacter caminithermalis DSM 15212]